MYWWLSFFYLLAKVLEHFDDQIYSMLGFISGHSLKHIAAALGLWIVLNCYEKRTILLENQSGQEPI